MRMSWIRRVLAAGILAVVTVRVVYAITINSIVSGTIDHLEATEGPATVAVVDATYAAGEAVGWHYHPGESYVIVKSGSITNEEPCGRGTRVYTAGQAFSDEAGHIHRASPSLTEPTNIAFIAIVPLGQPRTIPVPAPVCVGPPASIADCQDGKWQTFTVPRVFRHQGECVRWVTTGQ